MKEIQALTTQLQSYRTACAIATARIALLGPLRTAAELINDAPHWRAYASWCENTIAALMHEHELGLTLEAQHPAIVATMAMCEMITVIMFCIRRTAPMSTSEFWENKPDGTQQELAYWRSYADVCQQAILALSACGPNLNRNTLRPTGIPTREEFGLPPVDPRAKVVPLWT